MTNTRVDHHHGPTDQPASGTAERHVGSGGLVRRAAAGISALSAVTEPEDTSAVAAMVDEPNGHR